MNSHKAKTLVTSLILLLPLQAIAEDKNDELPSIELLEFLGEWTDDEHKWIDPLLMKDIEKNSDAKNTTEDGKDD